MRNINSSDTINFILEKNIPCLFIDTCSILDIIRIPFRDINVNNYFDFDKLINLANDHINIFFSDFNLNEYKENVGNVKIELSKHIQETKVRMEKIQSLANFTNCGFDLEYSEIDRYNLQNKIENIINKFISSSNNILLDEQAEISGGRRATSNTPPSANGKNSDSIFYCSYLDIWEKVRKLGFDKKIIFITSNSKDFGKTNNIPNPIKHELEDNNILYLSSFSWCYSEIIKDGCITNA